MPTITLDKKDMLKLVGKTITDKQLSEVIPLLGTDLEKITKNEIHVEIFPNRPDMLSEEGFARALSSFLGIKKGLRNYKVNNSSYKYSVSPKVKSVRPHSAAAVVKGIKFTNSSLKSIMNLQDKLHMTHGRNRSKVAMGLHDMSEIKFPLKYTTVPRSQKFQALENSVEKTISQILDSHPKGKDYAHLLDKKEVPVWLDSKGRVLSMPPVINSELTKVTGKTKDVFLDVTGTNKEAVEQALNILVTALADRGGKIYSVNNQPNLKPNKMKVDFNKINKLLGLNLTKPQVGPLLAVMGMEYMPSNSTVSYPAYRTDILSDVDIVEDVAIAYGYDNFDGKIPNISTIAEEDPLEKFKNTVADLCVGLGLQEVSSYHLSNYEDETTKMNACLDPVKIKNSRSKEYDVLRPWIIPSLMNVLGSNRHNEYPQNIFEVGKVFVRKGNSIKEPTRVAVALCHSKADYTGAKKMLDALLSSLGLVGKYGTAEHESFIPGRVARVSVKDKKVAYVGEIHPQVIRSFDIDMPVAVVELNLTDLFNSL